MIGISKVAERYIMPSSKADTHIYMHRERVSQGNTAEKASEREREAPGTCLYSLLSPNVYFGPDWWPTGCN